MDLPKCVEDFVAKLDKKRETAVSLAATVNKLSKLFEGDERISLRISEDVLAGITVTIHATVDNLSEAAEMRRVLAANGFHLRPEDWAYRDIPQYRLRVWELTDNVELLVSIVGENCKRVQVGVKEEPVYEIQCN